MRFAFVLLLMAVLLTPGSALGRLVQPDGSVVAVGEESAAGGVTYLFASRTVDSRSWITLPTGSTVSEAKLVGANFQQTLSFPAVSLPGVRFSVEVPARVLSLSLQGRFGLSKTLVRTKARPGSGAWVSRSAGDLVIDLPEWKTAPGYRSVLELIRPEAGAWNVTVTGEGRSRGFVLAPTVVQWDYAPWAWGFAPTRVVVTGADARLAAVRVRAFSPQADLPADPETILAQPVSTWRNPRREWYAWSGTSVLVLVTADYRVQDDYLRRLAFFVEKQGYRGRLVSDAELGGQHGWNAHDYAAPDLARFFTQAAQEHVALNGSETELRERLTAAGVLVARGSGAWDPGTGALVGVSAASPPALRAALFTHEAFHGLYFTSPSFRSGVAAVWSGLSEPARAHFRAFLAVSQYDPEDEGLMTNEFQAYVLQRPESDWTAFFRERVLGKSEPAGDAARTLEEYRAAAHRLDTLVGDLYGLRSGVVSTVSIR
jgi:hypothetical protein